MYVAALFSIEEIKTLNEEDEVEIILIPFIKEKKKKQKKKTLNVLRTRDQVVV